MKVKQLEKYIEDKLPYLNGFTHFVAYLNVLHDHDIKLYFHSLRVGCCAAKVAEEEGWPEKYMYLAFVGGLLHDFGKVKISPTLLNIKNPDHNHYNELKKHAEYGFEMLRPFSKKVASIAGGHHMFQSESYGLMDPSFSYKEYAECLDSVLLVSMADFWDASNARKTKIIYMDEDMTPEQAITAVFPGELKRIKAMKKITGPEGWDLYQEAR